MYVWTSGTVENEILRMCTIRVQKKKTKQNLLSNWKGWFLLNDIEPNVCTLQAK